MSMQEIRQIKESLSKKLWGKAADEINNIITVLHELWSKAFTLPVKAANYLGCSVVYAVNDLRICNI